MTAQRLRGKTSPDDPRWITVQLNVRMPWFYRKQWEDAAKDADVSLNSLIMDALERVVKPAEPR